MTVVKYDHASVGNGVWSSVDATSYKIFIFLKYNPIEQHVEFSNIFL